MQELTSIFMLVMLAWGITIGFYYRVKTKHAILVTVIFAAVAGTTLFIFDSIITGMNEQIANIFDFFLGRVMDLSSGFLWLYSGFQSGKWLGGAYKNEPAAGKNSNIG